MLRSLARLGRSAMCTASRRAMCTASPGEAKLSPFHERVREMKSTLLKEDWTDSDEVRPVDVQIEKASGIIDEYRTMYTADTPEDDELYKDVSELYFVKEVAAISEAYAYLAELRLRRHEGMLGFFGDNIILPEGEGEHTIEMIRDYIALMGKIENEKLRTKVELELGGKMVQLRMFLSAENFSVSVVPIAGDRILIPRPRPKELPKNDKQDSDALPPKSDQ